VLGRPLTGWGWAAVAAGFGGVALISQVWRLVGPGISAWPILELLAAALSWAAGTVLFQRRFPASELLQASAYQLAGGFLGLLVGVLITGVEPLPRPTPDLVAASLWLGLVGTAVAYAIWFTILGHTPAARASAYLFLVPLVALTASILLLGERLVWAQAAGVALVLVAVYGVGRTRWKRDDLGGTALPMPPAD
jgi:drug/metabolite transporter (DMT)-like permease